MTETTLSEVLPDTAGDPAPAPRPAFFGGRSKQTIRAIGLVIVLLSVFVSSGSFLIMIRATDIEPTPEVWTSSGSSTGCSSCSSSRWC